MDQVKTTKQSSTAPLLVEELMLILLNENSGYLDMTNYWNLECAIAGAIMGELSLLGKIDIDPKSLYLIDSELTGDEILDPFLTEIVDGTGVDSQLTPRYWIEKFAVKVDPYLDLIFERLIQKNYLALSDGGFYTAIRDVVPQNIGETPTSYAENSRNRIKKIIRRHELPNPREALLIALLDVCSSMQFLFEPEEHAKFQERITFLGDLELLAQSLKAAVAESYITLTSQRSYFREKQIPRMPLRELMRKSMQDKNMGLFFNEIYEKYGPVVEIWFPKIRQRTVMLLGSETNTWLNRNGRFFFRSKDYINDLESAFGANESIAGMDGREHFRMRKLLRHGYARHSLELVLPHALAVAKRGLKCWEIGKNYPLTNTINLLLSAQVSEVMVATDITNWQQDFLAYEKRCIMTEVQRSLPHFMLRTPAMKRKLKSSIEMVDAIRNNYTPAQRQGQAKNLIDYVLDIHRTDQQLLPETDLFFTLATPVITSAYMGAQLSFVIWHMLKYPQLLDLIRGEAEKIFADGREPKASDFHDELIPYTHHLILECLRMYPTIPGQLRHVTNECSIGGFRLPFGLRTYWAISAPHYSEEHYTNPKEFDIHRFAPPREEHRTPGTFNPWGLGTHVCMGNRWVELQLAYNTLLLAHYLEMELPKSSQKLKIDPFPKNAPHKKIAFRITGHRDRI